tara:strand:- start:42 stop:2492 length:2451 start_codon:yes stop_codon:yes gene_type:complete
MAAPVWITPPGDLGTVVEGEFYQVQLNADFADSYKYLSGVLPVGIRVTQNGILEGNPKNYDYIQGVPIEVAQDVTSKFVVRAISNDGTVADRVFEMTVTGQDAPTIDTLPDSDLGTYFDGDKVDVQFTATDPDPADVLTWRLQSGNLPNGLEITSTGNLIGYIEPFTNQEGTPGFDATNFDMQSWDFRTISVEKRYEFVVEVSDSKDVALKTYSLYAASRNLVTADMDLLTTDNYFSTTEETDIRRLVDASQTNLRRPAMLTQASDLGTIRHDNYFSFQVLGRDFDGDTLEFQLVGGFDSAVEGFDSVNFESESANLPPGLVLDPESGWISGYIPQQFSTTKSYNFGIFCRKRDNTDYVSQDTTSFSVTIEGDIDSVVTWPDKDLGTIKTGEQSQLDVIATISDGRPVQYELKNEVGAVQRLPQGLNLNSSGLLLGRVSFETLMFDTGRTTFDIEDLYTNETTFENTYQFTVRVFSADGVVDTYKEFSVTVDADTNKPYETLFARSLPSQSQRDIYNALIQNNDDIPQEDVYRASDYAFGVQTDIRAVISAGLKPVPETDYIEAMSKNFWNNTLRFGSFKTAQALNEDGTVKYEVVYIELIDNKQGIDPTTGLSASPVLKQDVRSNVNTWSNPLTVESSQPDVSHGHYLVSQANDTFVYPNSIENMRERLKTDIGYQILERKVLPQWMQDKQTDDTIIGWTLAAPVVYCKPGKAEKIKYRLEQRVISDAYDVKLISFEVDRFILDNNLSRNFDKTSDKFTVTIETTFDVGDPTTVFDGDGTRFIANVDSYANKDEGDKFIKFTQVGPFDRLPYTER